MKSKNIITIGLGSFLTTALIVVGSGMGTPDENGFLYAFKFIPVLQNTLNADKTFTITYLPSIIIIFVIVVLIFALIFFIMKKNKKSRKISYID